MKLNFFLLFLFLINFYFASSTPLSGLKEAFQSICKDARSLLPVVIMVMIIFAGVVYAAGQMMGAETRARANVWATAALTGALIGVLIYAIAPPFLSTIYNSVNGSEAVDLAEVC
jgi:uncharacterized membrane protein